VTRFDWGWEHMPTPSGYATMGASCIVLANFKPITVCLTCLSLSFAGLGLGHRLDSDGQAHGHGLV